MTDTVTEEVIKQETTEDTGRYVHIVSPPENHEIFAYLMAHGNDDPSAKDIVDVARKNQWRVRALCGYTWIPTGTGEGLDACPICMDVAGMHMRNAGE